MTKKKRKEEMERNEQIVVVRGGGDIATGTIAKLHHSGYKVLVLEAQSPSAIRRHVALSEAVYEGTSRVEDIVCQRVTTLSEARNVWDQGQVPLMVDPEGTVMETIRPWAVVDAILAKKNLELTAGWQISRWPWGRDLRRGRMWTSSLKPCAAITWDD